MLKNVRIRTDFNLKSHLGNCLRDLAIETIQIQMVWQSSLLVLKCCSKSLKGVLFNDAVIS
jgi:hypothetical protein